MNKVHTSVQILIEDEMAIRELAARSGCSISNVVNILVFVALENMSGDDLSSLVLSQASRDVFFSLSGYQPRGRGKKILSVFIDRSRYDRLCHLCYLYSFSFSTCLNVLVRYSLEKVAFVSSMLCKSSKKEGV